MALHSLNKLFVGLSFFACTSVFAAPLTFDVSGIQSFGARGQPGNPVYTFDVGANATITSVSYNVNLTAFTPSWLSEVGLSVSDSALVDGIVLTPGFGVDASGTGTYTAFSDLVAQGLSFSVGADGMLRLEFYEGFDDEDLSPDGIWNVGTVTFNFAGDPVDPGADVPEPASAPERQRWPRLQPWAIFTSTFPVRSMRCEVMRFDQGWRAVAQARAQAGAGLAPYSLCSALSTLLASSDNSNGLHST